MNILYERWLLTLPESSDGVEPRFCVCTMCKTLLELLLSKRTDHYSVVVTPATRVRNRKCYYCHWPGS